jgi:hypothetical protein
MNKYKKTLLTFVVAVFLSLQGFAQNDAIGKFFSQYENNDKFTVVSISPKMFKMVSKIKWDDMGNDLKQTIEQITSLRILTTETNGAQYYKEAIQKLNVSEYEELMTVKDENSNVRFLAKEKNNIISELLMLVGGKDSFVLMSITGSIDLDKISKLGGTLSIQGMDKLKDFKKKK